MRASTYACKHASTSTTLRFISSPVPYIVGTCGKPHITSPPAKYLASYITSTANTYQMYGI